LLSCGDRNLALEDLSKALRKSIFDLRHGALASQLAGEGRHRLVGDPARHDQIEVREIGGDVERDAVARDPARDPNPDGADLPVANPRAAQPRDPAPRQPRVARTTNKN